MEILTRYFSSTRFGGNMTSFRNQLACVCMIIFAMVVSTPADALSSYGQYSYHASSSQMKNNLDIQVLPEKSEGKVDLNNPIEPGSNTYRGSNLFQAKYGDLSSLSEGNYLWHTFFGSSGDDEGFAIAADADGGIYITGWSAASWDGPQGQPPLHAYSGSYELFVLKLDAAGAYQWHTFYGSESVDDAIGIAVDVGGVYLAGGSYRSWNGPQGQAPLHVHSSGRDFTIIKLDTSGEYQWHTFFGPGSDNFGGGWGIALDSNDDIYVTGSSKVSWDGPEGQVPLHAHSGSDDLTVIKLDTSGAYQWHTFYGSPAIDCASAIAVDASDGIYITGWSTNSWTGPLGQAALHTHGGYKEIMVLKLSALGAYQWHTFYGSAGDDDANGVATHVSDGVYLVGASNASWNGPQGQAPLHAYGGGYNLSVLKLDASGSYQWHTFWGFPLLSDGSAISVDEWGGIYLVGASNASWVGSAGQAPLHSYAGKYDLVVLKLNSSGAYLWHTFFGSFENDLGMGIKVNHDGIYVAGRSGAAWYGSLSTAPLHAFTGSYEEITVLKLQGRPDYHYRSYLSIIVR
jgi:hypothetical protein